jgi:hypothetical protein
MALESMMANQAEDIVTTAETVSAGGYNLVAQGNFQGGTLSIELNQFGNEWTKVLELKSPSVRFFNFHATNIRAKLIGVSGVSDVSLGVFATA